MRNFNGGGAMPLPMAGPRVDDSLSRHGSVQPFLSGRRLHLVSIATT